MDKEAECAVILDWLKKDGKAKGDPTAWIDAIAQETDGWPQHILAYVKPALDQLDANNGIMTANALNVVLEKGRAGRAAYYKQRVNDFRGDQIRCLARSVAEIPPNEPVEYRDILSSITTEYDDSEAKKLFRRFLERGILEKRGIGYAITIPSMHNWLGNEYASERIKFPHEILPMPELG